MSEPIPLNEKEKEEKYDLSKLYSQINHSITKAQKSPFHEQSV